VNFEVDFVYQIFFCRSTPNSCSRRDFGHWFLHCTVACCTGNRWFQRIDYLQKRPPSSSCKKPTQGIGWGRCSGARTDPSHQSRRRRHYRGRHLCHHRFSRQGQSRACDDAVVRRCGTGL